MKVKGYFSELEWLGFDIQYDAYILADMGPTLSEDNKKFIEDRLLENARKAAARDRLFCSVEDRHLSQLLYYRYNKGLSGKEIALLTQRPVQKVYRDLAKARKEVQKMLDAKAQKTPCLPRRSGQVRKKTKGEGCE